jgi:hypothetical protein
MCNNVILTIRTHDPQFRAHEANSELWNISLLDDKIARVSELKKEKTLNLGGLKSFRNVKVLFEQKIFNLCTKHSRLKR